MSVSLPLWAFMILAVWVFSGGFTLGLFLGAQTEDDPYDVPATLDSELSRILHEAEKTA